MITVYKKTSGLQNSELHYCPGCSHGIVHKLIGEVMEELDRKVRAHYHLGETPETGEKDSDGASVSKEPASDLKLKAGKAK